jgi:2-dehydro-3-deoxyphosphogluconate aldolase/(4S)-4-hydroxy-2-oxoglutarate aldolase
VLAVLRPSCITEARLQLQQLHQAGLLHVELAVAASPSWVAMARQLKAEHPLLRLGAASITTPAHLVAALAADLSYAVSPIWDPQLLQQAAAAGITLVPGAFSPTEIAAAVRGGAAAVKLFPAAGLGPGYWQSLAGPLAPLPFCIAAGGLAAADVPRWLEAGVDAVALGGRLFDPQLSPDLAALLRWLAERQQHARPCGPAAWQG